MTTADAALAPRLGLKARIEALSPWARRALAMAAGGVGALGFAPFYLAPLLALSLCCLVWLFDGAARTEKPVAVAFGRGMWWGLGHFLAGTYWVGAAFTQVEGAEAFLPLGVASLAAILAVFPALAGAAAMAFWTQDWRRLAVFAAAFGAAEYARGHVFGGLPWNLVGYTWPAGGAMSQTAAYVGIYGLSVLTTALMAAPAALAADAAGARSGGGRGAPLLAAAVVFGMVWGLGAYRLELAGPVSAQARGPVIRVVDPGYTQKDKWTPGREWEVAERYLALTGPAQDSDPTEIVVWPEGAIPARYPDMPVIEENPALMTRIGETLGDRVLIMGATRLERGAENVRFFNSAYVLDGVQGDLRIGQWRDKYRLTPFGEFIPFWDLVAWLPFPALQQIGAGFTPGETPGRIVVPGAKPALPLICYESIFPGLVPRGVDRPGWLVNISVDAWYGDGAGPWQNDNQSRYRAIEEGLPMARAASGGVSSVTDSFGRVTASVGRTGGAAAAPLPAALEETPYARYGFLLTPALFLLIAVMRLIPVQTTRRGWET